MLIEHPLVADRAYPVARLCNQASKTPQPPYKTVNNAAYLQFYNAVFNFLLDLRSLLTMSLMWNVRGESVLCMRY